jgi:hypothetical protein
MPIAHTRTAGSRWPVLSLATIAMAIATACSSGQGAATSTSTGGATSTGTGGATGASTGSTSDTSALGDGGSGDAGAGPSYATPYFPLAVGLSWTWPACSGSTPVTTTISSDSNGVFTMTNPPGCYFATLGYSVSTASSGDTDVNVIEPQGGGTYLEFDFPPAQGKTWAAGGASGAVYQWDMHYDTYTVPAGTFSDCWHMTVSGQTSVLCRDVGEVSFNSTNLVSKNF